MYRRQRAIRTNLIENLRVPAASPLQTFKAFNTFSCHELFLPPLLSISSESSVIKRSNCPCPRELFHRINRQGVYCPVGNDPAPATIDNCVPTPLSFSNPVFFHFHPKILKVSSPKRVWMSIFSKMKRDIKKSYSFFST